ncbi:MAG: HEAT repeat domain-containing protein [Dehalococcoidia bacterium]|nr:HEAT repeat domain-containing protein [Dehalococcoidia bacterium]
MSESEIQRYIKALESGNPNVRSAAADALGMIGDEAAVPALIDALKDEFSVVRTDAAFALGRLGAAAVPALIEALKEEEERMRAEAAFALGEIGRDAKSAVLALIEALNDEKEDVRREAAWALEKIEWEE